MTTPTQNREEQAFTTYENKAAQLVDFATKMRLLQAQAESNGQPPANLDNPFGLMTLPPPVDSAPESDNVNSSITPTTASLEQTAPKMDEDLGAFLKWAFTKVPPYSPTFLDEMQRANAGLLEVTATPQGLSNASRAMTSLSYIAQLVEEEERRLHRLHEEFLAWKSHFQGKYTEEQAAQWLTEYIGRHSKSGDLGY